MKMKKMKKKKKKKKRRRESLVGFFDGIEACLCHMI